MFTPEGAVVLGKLLDGFVLNLQIFVITLIGSLPLGLIIMFGSRSRLGLRVFGRMFRPIRLLTRGFVWVEIITLVKDTSLSRIISVTEILFVADNYTRQGLLWPLFTTAIFFLIFNGLVTLALGRIERKMDYFRA